MAAVTAMSRLCSRDHSGKFPFVQPARHGVLEYAAWPARVVEAERSLIILACAASGHDENESISSRVRYPQEREQGAVRCFLGVTVEVELCTGLDQTASQTFGCPSVEPAH